MHTTNPQTMADKWSQNLAGAGKAYTDGINSVTVSPAQLANTPEAIANYLAGVQRSVNSGKRSASLNNVSLEFWKSQSTKFGAQNLASGAQKGKAKYQKAMQYWGPVYQQASQAAAQVQGPKGMATAQAKWQAAVSVLMQAAQSA